MFKENSHKHIHLPWFLCGELLKGGNSTWVFLELWRHDSVSKNAHYDFNLGDVPASDPPSLWIRRGMEQKTKCRRKWCSNKRSLCAWNVVSGQTTSIHSAQMPCKVFLIWRLGMLLTFTLSVSFPWRPHDSMPRQMQLARTSLSPHWGWLYEAPSATKRSTHWAEISAQTPDKVPRPYLKHERHWSLSSLPHFLFHCVLFLSNSGSKRNR